MKALQYDFRPIQKTLQKPIEMPCLDIEVIQSDSKESGKQWTAEVKKNRGVINRLKTSALKI